MLPSVITTSRVSVYAVDDQGTTGSLVGTGALVGPRTVLVRAPLSTALARGGAQPRLRVGIATSASDLVEILDPTEVQVFRLEEDLLVGLMLSTPALSPSDQMAGLEDARDERSAARAVQAHLAVRTDPDVSALLAADAERRTITLPTDGVGYPGEEAPPDEFNPFCKLLGHGRWCSHLSEESSDPAPVAVDA